MAVHIFHFLVAHYWHPVSDFWWMASSKNMPYSFHFIELWFYVTAQDVQYLGYFFPTLIDSLSELCPGLVLFTPWLLHVCCGMFTHKLTHIFIFRSHDTLLDSFKLVMSLLMVPELPYMAKSMWTSVCPQTVLTVKFQNVAESLLRRVKALIATRKTTQY